jgi:hypothetical protein
MAISRLNYTGRKRIGRKDVRITVHESPAGPPSFDADLRLKDYKLPADALVFVEAYRRTLWMRFPFGKVGALVPPADRRLAEFDTADGILFRVRISASADRHGAMLAEADKVPRYRAEEDDENRSPLLPVGSRDLGQEVYRVDYTAGPMLFISKTLDKQAVATSPAFRSLVCASAMREILTRILYIEDYPDLDDHGDWKTRWLLFAANLHGAGEIPAETDNDAFEDWIESAVAAFARQQHLLDCFGAFWAREEKRWWQAAERGGRI